MKTNYEARYGHTRKARSFNTYRQSKKVQAELRQSAYDGLSVKQKIQALDARLGVGIGAVKQRAKLQALLDNQ